MRVLGVIPARLGSVRLPEKMLADVGGRPLVVATALAARSSGAFDRVVIAGDHERILSAASDAGFEAFPTDPNHLSGTARVAEVAGLTDAGIYVNIQGDEPLVDPEGLRRLVAAFTDAETEMATLWFPLRAEDRDNPNAVKVVGDSRENALYFSRSLIPFPRSVGGFEPRKHIGVYAFRRETLIRLAALPQCGLERVESLEQLRALYHGIKIRLVQATRDSPGVDTEADLERVRAVIGRGGN